MKKIEVGQIVYFENDTTMVVEKVGSKYFYTGRFKFDIETLRNESDYSYKIKQAFLSKEEVDKYKEYNRLQNSIHHLYVSDAKYRIISYDLKDRFTIEELQMIESKLKEVNDFILNKGK